MPQPPRPGRNETQVEYSGTVIETDEDVRQALLSGGLVQRQSVSVEPVHVPPPPPPPTPGRSANPFRPTARPPVPILTVCDDGKLDGEVIRIRDQKFTIGRTEGDLRFPLDGRMSSKHVEITHQVVGAVHRWVVTDLQSTHGTFVRVSKTALADKAEFLVGNGRYRFDAGQEHGGATAAYVPEGQDFSQTHGWNEAQATFRPPALSELVGRDIGNRTLLVRNEYWIGSDPSCPISRPDDSFCEPRHVRLHRGSKGWHAEHNKTPNGLWLRMSQITVDAMVQFQVGEQRFRLKVQ